MYFNNFEKYTDYKMFVMAVIERAEQKSNNPKLRGLFDSHNTLLPIIYAILKVGWIPYLGVCELLVFNPFWFAIKHAAFIVVGIGVVILAALGSFGGKNAIEYLYQYGYVALAVKEIGLRYKDDFDSHKGNQTYIDNLIEGSRRFDFVMAVWI